MPKGVAIVVGPAKHDGQFRICRWRGGQQHWSLPVVIGAEQLQAIADWTQMPLTEAKRLAAAAFERNYLVRAMESAKGSVMDAAGLAGVDRSNFRRLLQRHALVKMLPRPKRPKQSKRRMWKTKTRTRAILRGGGRDRRSHSPVAR
jgi:hypothetical protein